MPTPKKVTLADGTVRYRLVSDIGRDPETGKRRQLTQTFRTKKEAEAEDARIRHQRSRGTYVAPSKYTVEQLIDSYLRSACFEREANTRLTYTFDLRIPRERLGIRLAQSITREDIEELRDWAMEHGRKRGGKAGTGLGPSAVRAMLKRLSAAYDLAEMDGRVPRNPVRFVRPPRQDKSKRATWSAEDARRFLKAAAGERLFAAFLLSALGWRRGEVCGLRWAAFNEAAATIEIPEEDATRVLVAGKVVIKGPKSARSARTLPLLPEWVAPLKALRAIQVGERLAAGEAYSDSGYVVCDELGEPLKPDMYSREFQRVARLAGVPRIRLHDTRHSANSIMEKLGVPPSVRAAWFGHTKAVNEETYTHSRPEDLHLARDAAAEIFRIGGVA